MSIQVENITKIYGSQVVLDHVNFATAKGEIVGLLGPNGAGKSTLMKILTCYIPPTSGDAFVNGLNVATEADEVKKRVGYLPENNPLYTDMYIREYLEFVAGIHKLRANSRKRIGEMIEMTGLAAEVHKKIGMLSKGYRQRVGLAQALIHDPEVLILDEPTSGLDPNQLVEIRNLISEVGKQKTILLSTHIMQEVEAICTRTIIINQGKIVADASTAGLSAMQPQTVIVVEFSKPLAAKDLLAIPGVEKATKLNETTWQLQSAKDADIRAAVNRFAMHHDIDILSLQRGEQSLEKIFQQLTAESSAKG